MGTQSKMFAGRYRHLVLLLIFLGLIWIGYIRFAELTEKTREGTTIGNIYQIRDAILLYYQDHQGVFPHDLNPNSPFGRYLENLPEVEALHPQGHGQSPQGNEVTYGVAKPEGYGRGWYYNYENGRIFVNSIGIDSRGNSYTTY